MGAANDVSHWRSPYPERLLIFVHQWIGSSSVQGWGLLSWFSLSRYFPKFSALSKHMLTIGYHVYIFDRCRHSSAAVAPVKYKCDSNNLRVTFTRSNILLTEKLKNGTLVTPTPGDGLVPDYGSRGGSAPGASNVRSVTLTVLYGFSSYQAQMIISMRECVTHNDFWPWAISSKSFSHDFAIKLLKYVTSCPVRSTACTILDWFFPYLAQMITSIRRCVMHNDFDQYLLKLLKYGKWSLAWEGVWIGQRSRSQSLFKFLWSRWG